MLVPFTYRFEPLITGLAGVENGINPNEVAGALLWVIPIILALALIGFTELRRTARHWRWLAPINLLTWEAAFFIVVVLLLCQSRSGYLALAISAVLLALWLLRNRWRWYFGVLLAIGVLVVGFAWRFQADQSLREAVGTHSVGSSSLTVDALDGRDKVWSRAILGIEKYPLTGMGMNVFRYQVNTLDPANLIYVGRDIAHAHNEFMQAALDLGIPGMIAFVGSYWIAFRMLSQIWRQATQNLKEQTRAQDSILFEPRAIQIFVLGLGGGLFAHLLYGLTDAVTLGAKPGILFWMLLGITVGLYQHHFSSRKSYTSQLKYVK